MRANKITEPPQKKKKNSRHDFYCSPVEYDGSEVNDSEVEIIHKHYRYDHFRRYIIV